MQNDPSDAFYWIGLNSIPGIGRITFRKLVRTFGSAEQALAAAPDALKEPGGLSDKIISAIRSTPWRERAEQEIAAARAAAVSIVTEADAAYPENLRTAPDPPLYLYLRGSITASDARAIALVGTRRPTQYGKTITGRIAEDLAAAGYVIVSGMARGIDTQAHQGALATNGRTIAVLGSGIDVPYPPENRGLMEKIGRSGAVVSENPFGTQPEAGYFPARNRIISGLSVGTVIIEATEDSGSLITANYALEQRRLLFAVPGNAGTLTSRGSNSLIKQGAVLVESAADILNLLGREAAPKRPAKPLPPLTADEEAVLPCLGDEPKHIDRIMAESKTSPGKLGGLLMTLELKGVVKQLPGKYFVRTV